MTLGLVLLYVGAVLFINGLSMLGKIAPKEAAVMNLFTGGLSLFVSLHQIASGDDALVHTAAFGLLFAFTYLWVAWAGSASSLQPPQLGSRWMPPARPRRAWRKSGLLAAGPPGRCCGRVTLSSARCSGSAGRAR